MSMFERVFSVPEKVLQEGSNTEGSKERIREIFRSIRDASEREKALRDEYGIGGRFGCTDEYKGYQSDSKGICIYYDWGRKELIKWNDVEKIIRRLIDDGEY